MVPAATPGYTDQFAGVTFTTSRNAALRRLLNEISEGEAQQEEKN